MPSTTKTGSNADLAADGELFGADVFFRIEPVIALVRDEMDHALPFVYPCVRGMRLGIPNIFVAVRHGSDVCGICAWATAKVAQVEVVIALASALSDLRSVSSNAVSTYYQC